MRDHSVNDEIKLCGQGRQECIYSADVCASVIPDVEELVSTLLISLNLSLLAGGDLHDRPIILMLAVVWCRKYRDAARVLPFAPPPIELVTIDLLLVRTDERLQAFSVKQALKDWQAELH